MNEREFEAKQAELDRLLNDPETRMDPDRVWALLAELSAREKPGAALEGRQLHEPTAVPIGYTGLDRPAGPSMAMPMG
jgi:hypothetical protein